MAKNKPVSSRSDKALREIIAYNITNERKKKFPERGGVGKCAEAFGCSIQQWSQYENGRRSPDEMRLKKIADIFGVTSDHLKAEPENWRQIRLEWLNRTKPGRKKITEEDPVTAIGEFTGQGIATDLDRSAATSFTDSPDSQQGNIQIVDIIQEILDLENKHERGEVPTSVYRKTMKTMSALINLASRKAQ